MVKSQSADYQISFLVIETAVLVVLGHSYRVSVTELLVLPPQPNSHSSAMQSNEALELTAQSVTALWVPSAAFGVPAATELKR